MPESPRYTALADQMLRLATAALTDVERQGYLELSRAWRRLAAEAAQLEDRVGDGASREAEAPRADGSGDG